MNQENATTLLESRIQEVLLEYIVCLEEYCFILYQGKSSVKHLDRFVIVLQKLRKLLQYITNEKKSFN